LKSFLLFISFFLLLISGAHATHNRAGEITYEHVSGLRYRVKITTYTKASATAADRNYLKIRWGDEPSNINESLLDSLTRSNGGGAGVIIAGTDVKMNEYIGEHTYSGPGMFTLQMEDPNRNEGVLNIATGPGGASVSVMAIFSISSVLVIRPGSNGHNNSVYLDRIPIQNACIYQPWIHNPVAIDTDGDELRYSLVPCAGGGGIPLTSWMLPSDYTTDPNDTFEIDPVTGDIFWDTPLEAGEYNVAIKVEEYRDGLYIGHVIRDMQITVQNCVNTPPVIQPIADKCVVANGTLGFQVFASDQGSTAGIQSLQAQGAPMTAVANVATFTSSISGNSAIGNFSWQPKCQEVRLEPYQVSFIATDIGNPILSTFETVRIQVVAPRVENPVAQSLGNQIDLNWNVTPCANIFTGPEGDDVKYLVYRRNNLFGFEPDECELGVPVYTGYTYLGETNGVNSNSYTDTDVTYGGVYCYMVVTVWPDGSESYASEEFCDTVRKEVPVMTRVSVNVTDITTGADTIQWSKPTLLDTETFPGPYTYRLYHTSGFSTPTELIYETPSFAALADGDTIHVHENINTADEPHSYRVEIYSQSLQTSAGMSSKASSVFLEITPSDNSAVLNMNHQVPWSNYEYRIYRRDPGATEFLLVGTSTTSTYTDLELENNMTYCYKVEAFGSYNAEDVPAVLINWSQEECTMPYDQTPPCAPELSVTENCEEFEATFLWTHPGITCGDDDVMEYRVYYSPRPDAEFQLLMTIPNADALALIWSNDVEPFSIAGCYAVTAVDSLNPWPDGELHQNESAFSNIICIDNCPVYELPNIFTPNGDGANDLLMPIKSRYVQDVDFKLYNRWGNLVFETTDPKLNWNGTNKDSGEQCTDGTYYYVARVNMLRLGGIEIQNLKGYVRLADGKEASGSGQ